MLVPPHSTKKYGKHRKRSLKKAQLNKNKKASATVKKARQKPSPAPKQPKRLEMEERREEHFAAASELLKNVIQSSDMLDPENWTTG